MRSSFLIGALFCLAAGTATAQRDTVPPPAAESPAFWAVSVGDLETAAAWYGRVFGVQLVREFASPDGTARGLLLRRGSLAMLIERAGSQDRSALLPPGAHDFDLRGLVKVGVYVTGIRALHTYWRAQGLVTDAAVVADETLGMLTFILRDPDGNRMQIFEQLGPAGR